MAKKTTLKMEIPIISKKFLKKHSKAPENERNDYTKNAFN